MATEKRLIDANALLAKFQEHRDLYAPTWESFKKSSFGVKSRVDEIDTCMADVINAPTVDAVEVVHGLWEPVKYNAHCSCGKSYGTYHYLCSACNRIAYAQPYGLNFCPNCGADMREVSDA